MEEIKLEVDPFDHQSLCHGCLSQGRKTVHLPPEELKQLFLYLILPQTYVGSGAAKFCWECGAMFRRVRRFRDQLEYAQNVLMNMFYQMESSTESLSKLSTNIKLNYDQKYEYKQLNNIQYEDEIKTEENIEDKNYLNFDAEPFNINDHSNSTQKNIIRKTEESVEIEHNSCFDDYDSDLKDNKPIEISSHSNSPPKNITTDKKTEENIEFEHNSNFDDSDSDFKDIEPFDTDNHNNSTPKKKTINKKYKKINKTRNYYLQFAVVKDVSDEWQTRKDINNKFINAYLDEDEIEKYKVTKFKKSLIKYVCKLCNKSFVFKQDYLRHRNLNHSKEGSRIKCLQCNKYMSSIEKLRQHWKFNHFSYVKCKICNKYCSVKCKSLHLKTHHSKIYSCTECKEELLSTTLLKSHVDTKHSHFICDYCEKVHPSKYKLLVHIRSQHCPELYKKRKKRMTKATFMKNKEASYCVECNKHFKTFYIYNTHYKMMHLGLGKVPCPECGKVMDKYFLEKHINNTHLNKSKFHCDMCNKGFSSKNSLQYHHINVHLKIPKKKDKICDICGKGFNTSRILRNHRYRHTGERPYACRYCSATFIQKTPCKTHEMKQHGAVKQ